VALKNGIQAAVDLVETSVKVGNGALLRFKAVGNASVAGTKNGHEPWGWLVLQGFLPFPRVFVRLRLVVRNVALINLVVEIVFEDAVGVRRVPFLGNKLHLLQNRLLVYTGVSLAM
jgi:hypothetical protein